jgi:uncharacterized membrane protein YgcG
MHYRATSKRLIFYVFTFFLIINFISTGAHTDMWDGVDTFLVAESMALKHSAKLHPDIPSISNSNPRSVERAILNAEIITYKMTIGKYYEWVQKSYPLEPVYSTRSLMLPALSVPFYYAAMAFSVSPVLLVAFFTNSLIITLTSLVIFCFSLEVYGSKRIAFILSLIFCTCSFILPYNTSLFPQPLQALLIIAAAFFIYKSLHFHPSFICNYVRTGGEEEGKGEEHHYHHSHHSHHSHGHNSYADNNNDYYYAYNDKQNSSSKRRSNSSSTTSNSGGSSSTSSSISISSITKKNKNKNKNNTTNKKKNKAIYFAGLGGLFLGLSVFAHPTSIIVIPGFIVYFIFSSRKSNSKKSLISFLIALAIVLFFMGLVNYWRFGSFTEFGYGSYFGTLSYNRSWTGLIGLLASPGKGLLLYFPPVILLPIALKYMYKENKGLFFLIIYVIIVHWLYFGTIDDTDSRYWSGAIAWGPRYMIPVLPFIALALGTLLVHLKSATLFLKISLITLCVAAFVINLSGILVWSEYGVIYGWTNQELYKVQDALNAMTWNPNYSPIILHVKILIDDYVSDIPVEQYRYTGWHYTTYGLAPCSYDLYILCKFGIIPILLLSVINVFLTLKIVGINISTINQFSQAYIKNFLRSRRSRDKV